MKARLPVLDKILPIFRKNKELIVVMAFAIVVGIIRLPYLAYQNFWWDEAAHVLAVEGILKHGYPVFPSGRIYIHAPLFSYLLALFFKIFGVSEFSARIESVIFSTLTLPLIYLLGKDLNDRRAGTIATVIVAFSPWAVAWARQASMYAQFQFFFLLTIYTFYKIYVVENQTRNSLKINILFIVVFLCTMLSHEFAITLIPSLLAYLLIARGIKWIGYRRFVIGAIVLAFLLLVFLFLIGFRIPFVFSLSWLWHKILLSRSNLLLSYETFYARYPVLSLLVVMGVSVLLTKRDKKLLFLYTNFLVPLHLVPIFTAWIDYYIFDRYLFFLLPIFMLTSSFSLLHHVDGISDIFVKKICEIATHLRKEKLKKLTTWMILLIVIFPIISNLYVRVFILYSNIQLTEAFSYYQPGHPNPWVDIDINYGGVRRACEFIEQRYQDGDAIISTGTHSYPQEHLPVYYYLQKTISEKNVSLVFLIFKGTQTKDPYLNSKMINTRMSEALKELEGILYHHNRTWIIINERLINLDANQHEIIDFILENTTLVYVDAEQYIRVYLWP